MIAEEFGKAHGLMVATRFGPSGQMRERIEEGDRVDLFASSAASASSRTRSLGQAPPGKWKGKGAHHKPTLAGDQNLLAVIGRHQNPIVRSRENVRALDSDRRGGRERQAQKEKDREGDPLLPRAGRCGNGDVCHRVPLEHLMICAIFCSEQSSTLRARCLS